MDDPGTVESDRGYIAFRLVWWLLRALLVAVIWFVVFGILTGFDEGLGWSSLLAGAVLSTVAEGERAWRSRRTNSGH